MATKIVSKLTARHLGFTKTALLKLVMDEANKDKTVPLYKIIGQVHGSRTGVGQDGEPWIMFTGSFLATNLQTGELITSPQAALPKHISALLFDAVKNAEGQPVEFGFQIGAKVSEKSATGYEYEVDSLIEQRIADPLAALAARAGVAIPQLAAPEVKPETAPEIEGQPEQPASETKPKASKK